MNFFSSDEYLHALARVWFPGRRCETRLFSAQGSQFRLLWREGLGPFVTFGPRADASNFLDFVEPVASATEQRTTVPPVRWIPRVALGAREVASVSPEPLGDGCIPAPYVDWRRFSSWTAFEAHVASRRANLGRDSARKRRRLAERFGPVRFRWDDRRPAAFAAALAWKSAQYDRSRVLDCFSIPQNVAMFRELCDRGLVIVSSLSAGERLVAVHLGAFWRGRLSWWVPAYEWEAKDFSPGRLLLEDLLRESHARADAEFDFLLGGEPYKYFYATHDRIVGRVGHPPLGVSLHDALRSSVKKALARYPGLSEKARSVEYAFARISSAARRRGRGGLPRDVGPADGIVSRG